MRPILVDGGFHLTFIIHINFEFYYCLKYAINKRNTESKWFSPFPSNLNLYPATRSHFEIFEHAETKYPNIIWINRRQRHKNNVQNTKIEQKNQNQNKNKTQIKIQLNKKHSRPHSLQMEIFQNFHIYNI